jgi:hypothetical protein
MIVTEIYNGQGLGNQLWCYVVTRVIAKDRGYDYGIMHPEKLKCVDFLNLDIGMPVVGGSGPEGGPPTSLPEGIAHYYAERKITHPETGADIRTYDERLVHVADNTKIDGYMQDEQYIIHRKDEIRQWLKINPDAECHEYSDENICIINFRGGEYVKVKEVFLPRTYWNNAVSKMKQINPAMRFVVVTDDVSTAKKFFPDFEVRHKSIAEDYCSIANAHYLILSNSSFAWFPAWLNTNAKLIIAPKYWAHHNISDGYWSTGGAITSGWTYLGREGRFSDYETCTAEFEEYKHVHASLFVQPKIENNFLVVSNYYNDLSWVPEYTDNYLVYDQSAISILPPKIDQTKVIASDHRGHNIRDYCTYILEHYDTLPESVIFCAGNVFPRHVSADRFNAVMNARSFMPIFESTRHTPRMPISHITDDGLYAEYNNSWYAKRHPTKYFRSYDAFIKFCFKNAPIPKYIKFAPGANYVVPKENILKYSKNFYQNLRLFVSHTDKAIPGESHIIEGALYTIWHDTPEPSEAMNRTLGEDFNGPIENNAVPFAKAAEMTYYRAIGATYAVLAKIAYAKQKLPSLMQYFNGKRSLNTLWTRPELASIVRIKGKATAATRRIKKLKNRYTNIIKDRTWEKRLLKKYANNPRLAEVLRFPLIESDALQAKCDYSFGDHSGVLGHVPGAYMKKANISNKEFKAAVSAHKGEVMTLFIDNVRLYKRPLAYSDWLHMKPIKSEDRKWLDAMNDEDLLKLCSEFPEKKFIIFTALEDTPLDKHIEGRIPENVVRINAANAVHFGGKIVPYQHGLERRMYAGYNHHEILKLFLLDDRQASKTLYVNHRNDTGNRGSLYELFAGKLWATVSPRVDYGTYLNDMKDHKFVLCPSGNGIESARNWETLYMRRVPVFKRHPCLEELFKDFPAVFVDDWSEVTEELLIQNEHLYQQALTMDIKKLDLDALFAKRTHL